MTLSVAGVTIADTWRSITEIHKRTDEERTNEEARACYETNKDMMRMGTWNTENATKFHIGDSQWR